VTIPDVLAQRYASAAMREIWDPVGKVIAERQLWLAVLRAQADLGYPVAPEVLEDYAAAIGRVDLAAIDERERVTRHDVKARIEEFNALAGHERIHLAMTSRDLTENVEQMQVRRSLLLIRLKAVAALARLAELALAHAETPLVARTHNVPAAPTTLGRRFAGTAEELLRGVRRLDALLADYPLRGLLGPVGTGQDMLTLLGGDPAAFTSLQQRVREYLGFPTAWLATGQVYPRSLDADAVATLLLIAAPASSFAMTMRLMSGADLVSEGVASGQVGSSAMPHKANARSCERINGLTVVLRGYAGMTAELAGGQWNEGDVACSVVRRVALPGAFLALDGLLETFLTVLDELVVFEPVIAAEVARELPFLATSAILTAAVAAGAGREQAHRVIGEHARRAAASRRSGEPFNLIAALAADPVLGCDRATVETLISDPLRLTGVAGTQLAGVCAAIAELAAADPRAAAYRPGAIR